MASLKYEEEEAILLCKENCPMAPLPCQSLTIKKLELELCNLLSVSPEFFDQNLNRNMLKHKARFQSGREELKMLLPVFGGLNYFEDLIYR